MASEKWSVEQLFGDERSRALFQRCPELMLLWECRDGKEATCIWRGYSHEMLQERVRALRATAPANTTYCVEFPSRKGPRDGEWTPPRKFAGGAKCLPTPGQMLLVRAIEQKWGATLDETTYMKTRGRVKQFYMKSDRVKKEPVFAFDTWEEVQAMAFARR